MSYIESIMRCAVFVVRLFWASIFNTFQQRAAKLVDGSPYRANDCESRPVTGGGGTLYCAY